MILYQNTRRNQFNQIETRGVTTAPKFSKDNRSGMYVEVARRRVADALLLFFYLSHFLWRSYVGISTTEKAVPRAKRYVPSILREYVENRGSIEV